MTHHPPIFKIAQVQDWQHLDSLAPAELERYQKFKLQQRCKQFLAGRAFAKHCYLQLLQLHLTPNQLLIQNSRHGLVLFRNDKRDEVHFLSISHSGPWVMFGMNEQPIGVDVEKVRAKEPLPKLIHFLCNEHEVNWLNHPQSNGPLTSRLERFTLLWCLKEACLKALGATLSMGPRNIKISFEENLIEWREYSFLFNYEFKEGYCFVWVLKMNK